MKLTKKQVTEKEWLLNDACIHFKVNPDDVCFNRFGDKHNSGTRNIISRSEEIDGKVYVYKMFYETETNVFTGELMVSVVDVEQILIKAER